MKAPVSIRGGGETDMDRRKLSSLVVVLVVLTALTLPGAASAAIRGHERGQAGVLAWLSGLWNRAVAVVLPATQEKGGPGIDPNGLTVGGDAGSGIDPNGVGCGIDPNGATTGGDRGAGIDPNG
jgi:hypothetical protein